MRTEKELVSLLKQEPIRIAQIVDRAIAARFKKEITLTSFTGLFSPHLKKGDKTMNEAKIHAEKRQSPRVKPSFSIRYKALQDGAETVDAGSVTCDVSTGGLRFMANEFFSTACRLILELDIPAAPEPIKAVSEVAWIQKAKPGAGYQYEVGNQFMEITEKDRERIAMYVSSHYH